MNLLHYESYKYIFWNLLLTLNIYSKNKQNIYIYIFSINYLQFIEIKKNVI
jgi:hypothetical protein